MCSEFGLLGHGLASWRASFPQRIDFQVRGAANRHPPSQLPEALTRTGGRLQPRYGFLLPSSPTAIGLRVREQRSLDFAWGTHLLRLFAIIGDQRTQSGGREGSETGGRTPTHGTPSTCTRRTPHRQAALGRPLRHAGHTLGAAQLQRGDQHVPVGRELFASVAGAH